MARKERAVARRLFEFGGVLAGRHLSNVTVGPALEPVVLSLEQQPVYLATESALQVVDLRSL
jgi:hypothetical protein